MVIISQLSCDNWDISIDPVTFRCEDVDKFSYNIQIENWDLGIKCIQVECFLRLSCQSRLTFSVQYVRACVRKLGA